MLKFNGCSSSVVGNFFIVLMNISSVFVVSVGCNSGR